MRVITHEAVIDRNRRIAQVSFFFSLISLGAAFIFGNSLAGGNETIALYFQCGVLPTLFMVILFSVRMANNWIREPLAWEAIQEAVRGLSSNAVMYHFVFPARHVLISPMGVYVLYPLFQDRRIVIRDNRWRLQGGFMSGILTFMRQEMIGNPARDARNEAGQLQRFLDRRLPESNVEVRPLIVFVNPRVQVEVDDELDVPIAFAGSDNEPQLKVYLRSQKEDAGATLTPEQIDQLDEELIYVTD